ncbi:MAG: MFS transporter [Hyphomonadaceae bacterium]|nr:MFS transporter [Hyphomonadaceae bacterium]
MADTVAGGAKARSGQATVIGAASLGTLFEWYDFFLYGALASAIAHNFFSGVNDATAFILALGAFAAGFVVRPFGALVFGRVGDIVGRKYAFVVTMAIMGVATFAVGLLPTAADVGVLAPILLVAMRVLQGLAIGGEYGGAAIYVAEHAHASRRGFATSCINATGTVGLMLALLVILATRMSMPPEAFNAWGWRVPFIGSIVLLVVSLWIRLQLAESPVFQRMKEERALSKAPLAEALGRWENVRLMAAVLVGGVAGSTVIYYCGHFYTMFFLERVLKLDQTTVATLVIAALLVAAPTYLFFGWLSDRLGRKAVIVTGLVLGLVAMFPGFHALTAAANPALAVAQGRTPVVVHADPGACSFQFDPVGRNHFDATSCDVAKAALSQLGVSYISRPVTRGVTAEVHVGDAPLRAPEPARLAEAERAPAIAAFRAELSSTLHAAGYPEKADPAAINAPAIVAIIAFFIMCTGMTYGPLAAWLVELFPARIRYTALSFPYHLGVGWVGGFLPTTAFAIVAATGDVYSGLWYPVVVIVLALAVALFVLPETRGRDIG